MSLFLILLAAGDSKRLKSNTPKPFQIVNNKTLLEHSLDAFKSFNNINKTVIVYNKNHKVHLSRPTHTIFTMLAMIQSKGPETLDTKWFQYEHEGKLGKARFVWADSSKVWNGQDSILCNHYRFDINIIDSLNRVSKSTDYFMEQIILNGVVREVWVSRVKPKKIIAAKVKTPWISLWAHIIETKEH